MITLSQRLKRQQEQNNSNSRISIRDKLLAREVQEMAQLLPASCTVSYGNVNELSSFILSVQPTEGFWQGGCFKFAIQVTEEYNMAVILKLLCILFSFFKFNFTASYCEVLNKIVASKYKRNWRSLSIPA